MFAGKTIQIADASQGERLDRQIAAESKVFTWVDIIAVGLIIGFGALQFSLHLRANDFQSEAVAFVEQARSLLAEGFYGFNGWPETVMPPGLPLILEGICAAVGCSPAILIQAMVVFLTLGFLVSYALLRYEKNNVAAAVSCVLLISSPIVFAFVTRSIWPDIPYFFTTMSTLLIATRLETAQTIRARILLALLFGLLLLGSLMLRSAGIALLTGLAGWLAVSFFFNRKVAVARCKTFLPILILGIAVQAFWIMQGRDAASSVGIGSTEWPLAGFPGSYTSQLQLKSGNYPELGPATLSDIPSRMEQNLLARVSLLTEMLTRHWINPSWSSLGITIPVLLMLLGVGASFYRTGGRLHDWYFVCNEAIYLLWPWIFEVRFFLPVVPLACLYLWRGGEFLRCFAIERPRAFWAWCLPISVLLGIYSSIQAWPTWSVGGIQNKLSAAFWMALTVVSAWQVCRGSHHSPLTPPSRPRYLGTILSAWGTVALPQMCVIATLTGLVGTGAVMQLSIGRDNLNFDVRKSNLRPDIEAAEWIRSHTAETAVVMARHVPIVYHYAKRNVIWFPPISNAQILMDGIHKHNVQHVIVVERGYSYYFPPEFDCFELLRKVYPEDFVLEDEGAHYKIFEVVSTNIHRMNNVIDTHDGHS